ncbi:MAG: hypothetical protein N3G20_11675, partial [Verrucomicrobiae bacterium]|nr:hypothetical protein [Verrucomicrobiae bacterium]
GTLPRLPSQFHDKLQAAFLLIFDTGWFWFARIKLGHGLIRSVALGMPPKHDIAAAGKQG